MAESGTLGGAFRLLGQAVSFNVRERAPGGAKEAAYTVPRVSWSQFKESFRWFQGEHVLLLGTTGSGKTTLGVEIVSRRDHVIAFGTKGRDTTMQKLVSRGWERFHDWPVYANVTHAVMWPDITKVDDPEDVIPKQHEVFRRTISGIYQQGGWCAFMDELSYLTDDLNLGRRVKILYGQGRSMGISILAGTQRPRFIPVLAYDQSTHIFFWRENDEQNLNRIAEINFTQKDLVKQIVANLETIPGKGGDFLYVNTRTGDMAISKVEIGA
jgi:hypothetical protein